MLGEKNFEQYVVKKFFRREREFFVNEDGHLEQTHFEILNNNGIHLTDDYREVLNDNNIDFGMMRIRNGTVELFDQSKSEGARKETIRILESFSERSRVKVVQLTGMYNFVELDALKTRVRPEIEAMMRENGQDRGVEHTDFSILKEAIRVYTKNYCSDCGKKQTKLDIHHIIAEEFNGTHNEENNMIGLCGGREDGKTGKGGRGMCHGKWQDKIKEGIIFPGIFDGELWMSVATKKKEESDKREAIALKIEGSKKITQDLDENDENIKDRERSGRGY